MKISSTSQKAFDGICGILKENGQSFSKSQSYAVESLIQAIEESTEKRCCEMTERILAKKDEIIRSRQDTFDETVSEATIRKVNEMVEKRVQRLKKEVPGMLDYAKMKRLNECIEQIKECIGFRADEQVQKVASESAKALHSTKTLIETQARQISEKSASLNESTQEVKKLNEKIQQMQKSIDTKDRQIVESTKKNQELVAANQNLQKKIDESKRINESLEQKRKSDSLRLYLEEKISSYPKYEASLLRKHFSNAKSRAEIDENFNKALAMVQGKRDSMRSVQPIPINKVGESEKTSSRKISGGETIVRENGGNPIDAEQIVDESFVSIDDDDVISNEQMQQWISRL